MAGGMGATQALGAGFMLAGDILGAGENDRVAAILRNLPLFQTVSPQQAQTDATAGDIATAPAAEQLAAGVNTFNQAQILQMLTAAIPGYADIQKKSSAVIQDELSGNIPSDVQDQIARSSAARALGGGYSGSGMQKNLEARDLGITSLNLTNQGLNSAEKWITTTNQTAVPQLFNFANMFLTPQQQFQDQFANNQALYESQITHALGQTTPGETGYWSQKLQQRGGQLAGFGGGSASPTQGPTSGGGISNWFSGASPSSAGGGSTANMGGGSGGTSWGGVDVSAMT